MSRRLGGHYVYRLIPPRPSFHEDMSAEERAIMGRHAEYWARLVEGGEVVAYGPVVDSGGSWGLLGHGRCLAMLGRAPEAARILEQARGILARLGARPALDETGALLARLEAGR
jgi:hypothetical protein